MMVDSCASYCQYYFLNFHNSRTINRQMIRFLYFITLFTYCSSDNFLRLSTRQWKTLKVGDSLISTLGKFKATLIQSGCQLQISYFDENTNTYYEKGRYIPKIYEGGDCVNLTIFQKNITTSSQKIYEKGLTGLSFNWATTFTIDDQGIIRLVGIYYVDGQKSKLRAQILMENKTFSTPQSFTKSAQQILITEIDMFGPMSNLRNWTFQILVNQLTMSHTEKIQYTSFYNWERLNITHTLIFDYNLYQLPAASFKNLTYHPRCHQPRDYLNYKAPYVFELNPYYPIITLYEQGGYPLIQISYSELSSYDFMQGRKTVEYYQYYSPCPPRTFQYRDKCLSKCPEPYFHEMRGSIGKCVLVCENYTPMDLQKRTCSCMLPNEAGLMTAQIIIKCNNQSQSTPYGCVCSNGTYFDSKYSLSCVKNCPLGTFASSGLCMQCPTSCQICSLDQYHRAYLKCDKCINGFTLYEKKGQCVRNCVNNHGYSLINGVCTKCDDQNCIDCSSTKTVCKQCGLLYSLLDGKCYQNCDFRGVPQYNGNLSSECFTRDNQNDNCSEYKYFGYKGKVYTRCVKCIFDNALAYQKDCSTTCPSRTTKKNGACVCPEGELMLDDQCRAMPGCPLSTYLHPVIGACLTCPYGCLTCNQAFCTSCIPGYHLFLNFLASMCRRNSPIAPCDTQQKWQRGICRSTTYTLDDIQQCSQLVTNCEICHRSKCAVCKQQFVLLHGKCVEKCPAGMTNYTYNCIIEEIPKCKIRHLSVDNRPVLLKNYQDYETSLPYEYYISRENEYSAINENDPIGYIYFLHKTGFGIPYNQPKHTNFYQPKWICLKCEDGNGLTDDFTQCIPCPNNCKICYMARNDSCLDHTSTNNTNNTNNTDPPTGCLHYIEENTGNCIESCTKQGQYPEYENGDLYCKKSATSSTKDYIRIDAANYNFSSGGNLIYFVFDRPVQNVQVPAIFLDTTKNKVGQTNTNYSLTQNVTIRDGCFIEIRGGFDTYLLNFSNTLHQIKGTQPYSAGLSSQIYGASINSTYNSTMTTWLAYIGYIVSIVIICLHFVFIGNQLLYKMDNLLIFVQTIYFFLYVKNLVGRLLTQFYFGWSFSHGRFLPNAFEGIIPSFYRQNAAPCPYKLVNMDGNFFRNAGFSLFWLLIYLAALGVVVFVVWLLYKLARKKQIWYKTIIFQALVAGIEFFSFNLIFFSMSEIAFSGNAYQIDQSYYDRSRALAIIVLLAYCGYTLYRLITYPLGGIYMLKRIIIAAILFSAYGQQILVIPLIIVQIIFCITRYILEAPQKTYEAGFIFFEGAILITCYLLLFLCIDTGVNTLIISIIVFIFIVYLAYDLTTIYLQYRNEYSMEELNFIYEQEKKGQAKRALNSPSPTPSIQKSIRESKRNEQQGMRSGFNSNLNQNLKKDSQLENQLQSKNNNWVD